MTRIRPVPKRALPRLALIPALLLCAVSLLAPAAAYAAAPPPSAAAGDVFYSSRAEAPQAQSPGAMRAFLATDHPEFNMQSYVWAGSLVDDSGRVDTFACEMQRNTESIDGSPILPFISSGALFNRSSDPGYVVGGFAGAADLTLPLSLTSRPWSVRAQQFALGQAPRFIDVRVVDGVLGKKGAVYEFTSYVQNGVTGAPPNQFLELYVRVRDTTGLMQWGYGPSGFFPQWIYPPQRAAISGTYGNSVGKYLKATGDPMTNQGDYYYTLPLLKVQRYTVSVGGQVVSKGSGGWIWFDNVEQQFDAAAEQVIQHGIDWMEFSVQFPKTSQAMKIGFVEQASVGQLSYAMLHERTSPKAKNGSFTDSVNWPIDAVHITPVPSSLWTSPASGKSYYLAYRVKLDGARPSRRAEFSIAAQFQDQEVVADGRTVYEGIFSIKGTLCGKKVRGQAWTEVQPSSDL